ncbi:unnamed protein product, partial [Didymodactylos carnosus]
MCNYGEIDTENELIQIDNVPNFVRIKWNNMKLASLAHGECETVDCVDGYEMKSVLCGLFN